MGAEERKGGPSPVLINLVGARAAPGGKAARGPVVLDLVGTRGEPKNPQYSYIQTQIPTNLHSGWEPKHPQYSYIQTQIPTNLYSGWEPKHPHYSHIQTQIPTNFAFRVGTQTPPLFIYPNTNTRQFVFRVGTQTPAVFVYPDTNANQFGFQVETQTPALFVYSGQAQYLYYSGGGPHAQGIRIFRPSSIFVLSRGGPTRPEYSYIQAKPNICIIPGGTHTPRVFTYSSQAQYLYYSKGAMGMPSAPRGIPMGIPQESHWNPCGTTTGTPWGTL